MGEKISYCDFLNRLKNNKLEFNTIIINGGENYLTLNVLRVLEKFLKINYPEFNKNIFCDDGNYSATEIVEASQVVPFCDEKRLVIVNDYLKRKNEQEKNIFLKYIKNPFLSSILVFYSPFKSDFFASLEQIENVLVIDCEKISTKDLNEIVNEMTKGFNVSFDDIAKKTLIDYCNYSPTKIYTELSKYESAFDGKGAYKITVDDVKNNTTKDIEYVVFDLTNAIGKKQKDSAFLLVDLMLKNKEQGASIISIIAMHFRRLFLISRSTASKDIIAGLLNIKPFAVEKYKEQLSFFSQRDLKRIFDLCVEVEFKCKSGELEQKNATYYLLAKIFN